VLNARAPPSDDKLEQSNEPDTSRQQPRLTAGTDPQKAFVSLEQTITFRDMHVQAFTSAFATDLFNLRKVSAYQARAWPNSP
jgi:hypothetical protein